MSRNRRKRRRRNKPEPRTAAPTESAHGQTPPPRRRITGWKKWALRAALVLLAPALVIGILEGTLWLVGYGYPTSYWIASEDGETYLSNPDFGIRFFGRALARRPIPATISRVKPENTYRVFVFGGSAALGTPNMAFSFARILEAMLNERFKNTRFEVINTGVTAINSHVVYPIAKECGRFDGDLYIVYMGNNEVVGPYGPGTVIMGYNASLSAIRTSLSLKATRSGQLLTNVLGGTQGPKQWRGMAMFLENLVPADDPRLETMYEHFRNNLRDICSEARSAEATVILSTVVTNLKDLPPFASVHRTDLAAGDKGRWDALYKEGIARHDAGDHTGALQQYGAAEKIDDRFADLRFRMGNCLLALKQYDRARVHFIQARDLDALRFRADTRINQIIRATAEELAPHDVHLVDAANAVSGKNAPGGIHGDEVLYEHVHPTFEGNWAIAAAMFPKVVALLPPSVRKDAAADLAPPSLERCAALLIFTDYHRMKDMEDMARLTARAPFPESRRAQDAAGVQRIKKRIGPSAVVHLREAYRERLRTRPDDILTRISFADFLANSREYAAAAEHLRLSLKLHPFLSPSGHNVLGRVLYEEGRFKEAEGHLEEALRLVSDYRMAHTNLSLVLKALGRMEEAHARRAAALRLNPQLAQACNRLGDLSARERRFDAAVQDYARAIWLKPDYAQAYHNRAMAYHALGKYGPAVSDFAKVVELTPEDPFAYNNVAWVLATCPEPKHRDGSKAVANATRAVELLGRDVPDVLGTLAAACAEAGDFKNAVRWQEKTLQLAPEREKDMQRQRLELYKAQKPFHETP